MSEQILTTLVGLFAVLMTIYGVLQFCRGIMRVQGANRADISTEKLYGLGSRQSRSSGYSLLAFGVVLICLGPVIGWLARSVLMAT